jgi:5-methylcytosine-specific restriction protein B
MSFRERVDAFAAAVTESFGVARKDFRESFGVSNSAKVIEGGVQLGVSNLENFSEKSGQLVLGSILRFPPEDEVYFAIRVKGDVKALVERLDAMKVRGAAQKASGKSAAAEDEDNEAAASEGAAPTGEIAYAERNNNAAIYLAHDGRLYVRNKRFWDSLRFDLATVGPGVEVDQILVAVWPPAASARRSLLAREFVGYLGSLVGRDKVHELQVWIDPGAVSDEMRRMPATLALGDIEASVAAQGGHYPAGEVRRLHAALNFLDRKHFVILSGLSGTGKTQLALQYARAIHGLAAGAKDPFLFVCPVRPEWTDPTSLLGYYDVLSGRYEVPRFLEAVLVATAHREVPVFVVLDEMNLARVEYYFSDVLSAMETEEDMRLHQNGVPYEGTTGTPVRPDLPLPPNLYVIGTINVDETTNPLSNKVLDRAVIIDMSSVDLAGFLDGLTVREPALGPSVAAVRECLTGLEGVMAAEGLGFGYRVAEEVVRYHAFATGKLGAPADEVADELMVQKVLVKLRGGERQRGMLTSISKAVAGLPRSAKVMTGLVSDLDEFSSFQATR